YLCSLSVLPSSPLCVYPDRVGVSGACPDPVGMVNLLPAAFSFSPLVCPACPELRGERSPRRATPHSPLTPIIPPPLATAALRVVPAPIFTTTLRIHVGAPTILFRERTTPSQQFLDRRAMLSSNCALLTVDCALPSLLTPIIPALTDCLPVSPIIPALTDHSPVSLIIPALTKTGGRGR